MDIYVQKDGQKIGPFSEARIRQGIDAGEFTPTDLAWISGKASWQPISTLISLDLSQAPPIPVFAAEQDSTASIATRADAPAPPVVQTKQITPVLTSIPPISPVMPKAGGPVCKRCGSPYNRWSLFRAIGSGLCRRCTKPRVRSKPIWDREVKSVEDAYKVIRVTAIVFVVCAVINFALGFVWMPIVVLLSAGFLWKIHSRVAAILLLILSVLDFSTVVLELWMTPGMVIGGLIAFIEISLSARSLQAIRKLRDHSAKSSVMMASADSTA